MWGWIGVGWCGCRPGVIDSEGLTERTTSHRANYQFIPLLRFADMAEDHRKRHAPGCRICVCGKSTKQQAPPQHTSPQQPNPYRWPTTYRPPSPRAPSECSCCPLAAFLKLLHLFDSAVFLCFFLPGYALKLNTNEEF